MHTGNPPAAPQEQRASTHAHNPVQSGPRPGPQLTVRVAEGGVSEVEQELKRRKWTSA